MPAKAGIPLVLVLAIFFGCSTGPVQPPPEPQPVAISDPFPALAPAADALAAAYPDVGATLAPVVAAAKSSYLAGNNEQLTQNALAVLSSLGGLPAEENADLLGLDVVFALEKDLHRLSAVAKEEDPVASSGKQWNMRCKADGTFTCEVKRGCYCVQLYFRGQLVGCASGRMANLPPGETCAVPAVVP